VRTHHKFQKIRIFFHKKCLHSHLKTPSPLSTKCPHWTTPPPPDNRRLLYTASNCINGFKICANSIYTFWVICRTIADHAVLDTWTVVGKCKFVFFYRKYTFVVTEGRDKLSYTARLVIRSLEDGSKSVATAQFWFLRLRAGPGWPRVPGLPFEMLF